MILSATQPLFSFSLIFFLQFFFDISLSLFLLAAYGQTGSGKSYTIAGPHGGRVTRGSEEEEGLMPRLCRKIFALVNQEKVRIPQFRISSLHSSLRKRDLILLLLFFLNLSCELTH